MNLLFRLLPAGMSRDGFTCGNKALDAPQTGGEGYTLKWTAKNSESVN